MEQDSVLGGNHLSNRSSSEENEPWMTLGRNATSATIPLKKLLMSSSIWGDTLERIPSSVTSVTTRSCKSFESACEEKPFECFQCEYATSNSSHLKTHVKIHSREMWNRCNQCEYACRQAFTLRDPQWGCTWKPTLARSPRNGLVWLCINPNKHSEVAFDAHWWEAQQVQPMCICIKTAKPFDGAHENPHWWETKQMHPVWQCHYSSNTS